MQSSTQLQPAQPTEQFEDPFGAPIDGLDESAQEHREPVYAAIQWHNGQKAAAKYGGLAGLGGFFINKREQKRASVLPNWDIEELEFEKGGKDKGPAAVTARLAVIRSRRCWMRKEVDGRASYHPWNKFQKGMQSKQQFLVAVEGCPEIFCLSIKGTNGQAFETAIAEHQKRVVSPSRSLAKQNLPPYAFWLTISGGQFVQVGEGDRSKWVTPPCAVIAEKTDRNYLAQQFVGKANLLAFQEAFKEAETWAKRWNDANMIRDASEDEDSGDSSDWACSPVLANQYKSLIQRLGQANGDAAGFYQQWTEDLGKPHERWTSAEMAEVVTELQFRVKRAENKATVKVLRDASQGASARSISLPADDEYAGGSDDQEVPF